jgi:SRSO17 transposase
MSLPVIEIPAQIKQSMNDYRGIFTKPQFAHFQRLIAGLIISDNKTVQEINDCFGDCDQSSLNKFLTLSTWDREEVEKIRMQQIKRFSFSEGILIIDPTLLHKSGRHIEKANYHYDGLTKGKEWGHMLIHSIFTDGKNEFPLRGDIYVREVDADEKNPFRTIREIGMEHIDFAIENKIPFWLVMADAGLYADYFLKKIKSIKKKYIVGVKISHAVSIDRGHRISIKEYLGTLTSVDFSRNIINGNGYYLHIKEVYSRRVGKERLLISYKEGEEDDLKIYTTNIFDIDDEKLMYFLLQRWNIEVVHRDAKQYLGLEDYEIRKFGAIQKVVCAVHVAYTQLALNKYHKILEPLKRGLETIGEGCRFFRLIAIKGWRWVQKKARNIKSFKEVMNSFVFVKNAKV